MKNASIRGTEINTGNSEVKLAGEYEEDPVV